MNWALGHAFNVKEMFINFPIKKFKLHYKKCYEIFSTANKDIAAGNIFKTSVALILNDVICNNVTFELPIGKFKADIHVHTLKGDEFIKARQKGALLYVDILKTFFTGHQLTFNTYTKGKRRKKIIYVNKYFKDKLINFTNSGKNYC